MTLVELLQAPKTVKPQDRARLKQSYATLDAPARLRQAQRHIAELERDNDGDVRIDLPKATAEDIRRGPKQQRGTSQQVRKILTSRRPLANHLDEAPDALAWHQAVVRPTRHASQRKFCSVCGYWGKYACLKCGLFYCTQTCQVTHVETRCTK
ncbi:hypothetical protein BCR37DRAFT_348529 [Protomyces lactucae-debilis]|uniref:HIT-type domain-containing protein n=1 Tax=Protomyces lactucae-debilis TaxID=2754530 RepID=A0A1Y2FAI1_PROLT|nr:uncharacterized protein BCR37DRAFT_348529 [Protomyces lactucae-debilis]ORY80918.1 hypothetical protein BCR37DRAFT_348529 [Protomyces lactucae-debilis]